MFRCDHMSYDLKPTNKYGDTCVFLNDFLILHKCILVTASSKDNVVFPRKLTYELVVTW